MAIYFRLGINAPILHSNYPSNTKAYASRDKVSSALRRPPPPPLPKSLFKMNCAAPTANSRPTSLLLNSQSLVSFFFRCLIQLAINFTLGMIGALTAFV